MVDDRSTTLAKMYVDRLLEWLRSQLDGRTEPLFIGLDGRSGAGKSTLAEVIRAELGDEVVSVNGLLQQSSITGLGGGCTSEPTRHQAPTYLGRRVVQAC